MFKTHKSYVIVMDSSFIIKDKNQSETIIEFKTHIPNVPFYHHLFDDYNGLQPIFEQVKQLKMKHVVVIMPDDTLELTLDRTIFDNYFLLCNAKKVDLTCQFLYLSQHNENYISLSKTSRNIVLHFVKEGKSLAKKFYDKEFQEIEQIKADLQRLHIDCEYGHTPVYINNMNNNMDFFRDLGTLVSNREIIDNAIKALS
ncbi:MAG: hypothetical protein QM644_19415 [Mobilitalea sp.]